MDHREQHPIPLERTSSRRAVFGGVLGLGVALPVLAACGSGEEEAASGGSGSASGGSGGSASGIPTADVPVGSGAIFEDQELVVTQPSEGEFKAFSSICTHQSCPVTQISEDGIQCTCHGSVFSLEDGSPTSGPAEEPLPEMTVTVDGDSLTIG